MFARLGSWCFRQRKQVVAAVGARRRRGRRRLAAPSAAASARTSARPSFESTRGLDILLEETSAASRRRHPRHDRVPRRAGRRRPRGPGGDGAAVRDRHHHRRRSRRRRRHRPVFAGLDAASARRSRTPTSSTCEGITLVSPYDAGGERRSRPRAPRPARSPLPTSRSPATTGRRPATIGRTLEEILPVRRRASRSSSAAQRFGEFEEPSTEALGLAFAVVILVVAFGSVLAMGLPDRRGARRHRSPAR